ncbi:hypothetical protein [Pseudomonas sp. dw_358]|uniref:hypothetical protein n=1 Tax=Pseudomonas sp. dw_358 TaxID=2720083 RepID=UPI001BD38171|nr:hypothetical protein [Pseudomonas sp. dw_358]
MTQTISPLATPISMTLEKVALIPGTGPSTFIWTQSIPLLVWTVPHNLGRFVSATVVNALGNKVEPDVKYVDSNIIQITFGTAFAGFAYLN